MVIFEHHEGRARFFLAPVSNSGGVGQPGWDGHREAEGLPDLGAHEPVRELLIALCPL